MEQQSPSATRVHGVPPGLVLFGSWAWRIVFIAAAGYIVYRVLKTLGLLVIPFMAALFLSSLLRPVAIRLRRILPGPLSALLTLLLALCMIGGIGYFIVWRAVQGMPALIDQFVGTVQGVRDKLQGLAKNSPQLNQMIDSATHWLQQHRSDAIDVITTGAGYTVEAVTALVLTVFISFFLLYDARRIWGWLLTAFVEPYRSRVNAAGQAAWEAITGYVRGTVAIAAIHAVVIGVALVVLGTPLAAPLAVLVFFGSFVPLAGALVAGGLAVVATLGTNGWIPALILTGVLLGENQLEAHVLQPLIMGHSVRLHPLAIGLAVTAGTLVGGIIGAVVAVPAAAIVHRTLPVLTGREDDPPDGYVDSSRSSRPSVNDAS